MFRPKASDEIGDDDILGWDGGFDVVLGNPPWETYRAAGKGVVRPATSRHCQRCQRGRACRTAIERLAEEDPALFAAFLDDHRRADGEIHLIRRHRSIPAYCGREDVNSYTLFAELNRQLIGPTGRVGCIIPSGIASDDTTKAFFQDLIQSSALVSLHSFENEEFLFPAVHHSTKFCLMTLTGSRRPSSEADFAFFCRRTEQLREPDRHFTLTADEIRLMNPNTGTCPIFRSKRDAEINKAIYRRVPV